MLPDLQPLIGGESGVSHCFIGDKISVIQRKSAHTVIVNKYNLIIGQIYMVQPPVQQIHMAGRMQLIHELPALICAAEQEYAGHSAEEHYEQQPGLLRKKASAGGRRAQDTVNIFCLFGIPNR